MKIFFHGASVTQQGQSDSYLVNLKSLLPAEFEVISKGYGGCHFSEAGVLTLANDLDNLTDVNVCVLEWNTTVLSSFKEEDLFYVLNVILQRRILPVFMILARLETIKSDRDSEISVASICRKFNIPLLDFRDDVCEADLRDEVHSSESGALKYANKLYNWLLNLDVNYQLALIGNNIPFVNRNIYLYDDIECQAEAGRSIVIAIKNISSYASLSIVIEKGPNSGYVKFDSRVFNLWDSWCFYNRPYFMFLKEFQTSDINGSTSEELIIDVLDQPVDYSTCRRPDFNFDGVVILKVISIYATNCEVLSWSVV